MTAVSPAARRVLLAEQPLGKIYSLRQFRHLSAQLHPHCRPTPPWSSAVPPAPARTGPCRSRSAHALPTGEMRDHPGEKPAYRDDRNEERQIMPRIHLGSRPAVAAWQASRSAKSIRSASSVDFLAAPAAARSGSRHARRARARSPVLARDALRDRRGHRRGSQNTNPPTTAKAATTSGWIHRSSVFLASNRSVKSTRSPRSPISRRGLLDLVDQVLAQQLQLLFHARVGERAAGCVPASARITGNSSTVAPAMANTERNRTTISSGTRYLAGGSRSASRCFATMRSRKSTRSPSSLICSGRCCISSSSAPEILDQAADLLVFQQDLLAGDAPGDAPSRWARSPTRTACRPRTTAMTATRPMTSSPSFIPPSVASFNLPPSLRPATPSSGTARMRRFRLSHALRRSCGHHAAAELSTFRAKIDHPVRPSSRRRGCAR